MKTTDLTGQRFGRLTVTRRISNNKWRQAVWLCRCDCQNEKTITTSDLKSNSTKSCGCLRKEGNNLKHGHNRIGKQSKTHKSWDSMKQRCINRNNKDYKHYGNRGITVCNEWLEFTNFITDMGEQPIGCSLERINNDKGYYKENCRWATRQEQARNRRNNRQLLHNGKTQCIAAWAGEYNIPQSTLRRRLFVYDWSIEKALTTPIRKKVKSSDRNTI